MFRDSSARGALRARLIVALAAIVVSTVSGCSNGAASASKPKASAQSFASALASESAAEPPPAPPPPHWCADRGGKGLGTLESMCAVKGPPPFEVRVLDKYGADIDGRMCSVTNNTDTPWEWGGARGFYYDKTGTLLAIQPTGISSPLKSFAHSGADFAIEPHATIEFECGWSRADEPHAASLEVEIYGWGTSKVAPDGTPGDQYYTLDIGSRSWDDRPPGGFKP